MASEILWSCWRPRGAQRKPRQKRNKQSYCLPHQKKSVTIRWEVTAFRQGQATLAGSNEGGSRKPWASKRRQRSCLRTALDLARKNLGDGQDFTQMRSSFGNPPPATRSKCRSCLLAAIQERYGRRQSRTWTLTWPTARRRQQLTRVLSNPSWRTRQRNSAGPSLKSKGRCARCFGRRPNSAPSHLQRRYSTAFCAVSSDVAWGFRPDLSALAAHLVGGQNVVPLLSAPSDTLTTRSSLTANVTSWCCSAPRKVTSGLCRKHTWQGRSRRHERSAGARRTSGRNTFGQRAAANRGGLGRCRHVLSPILAGRTSDPSGFGKGRIQCQKFRAVPRSAARRHPLHQRPLGGGHWERQAARDLGRGGVVGRRTLDRHGGLEDGGCRPGSIWSAIDGRTPSYDPNSGQPRRKTTNLWCWTSVDVKALHGVELLLPGAPGCPKVVCFGFFRQKMVCCVFCQFISNHCVCRNQTTLQIGNTHEYAVRRQICCLSRASGVIVVVSGPSIVSVVFPLVRSLFCNSGFWLRLFVARFWFADVG